MAEHGPVQPYSLVYAVYGPIAWSMQYTAL